jgi:eukaryotic-like serine/threonine-protein kinase
MYNNDLAWLLVTYPEAKVHAPAQAVTFAKKATELKPNASNLWNTLGVAYCRGGQYRDAIAALKKSEELGRGSEFGFNAFFIAMAHWQLRETDTARTWYDQAALWMEKNKPNDPELKRFRAEAAELLGVK